MTVETADKLLLSTIEPLLLDCKAVAKLLAISPRHVAALHSSGRLPMAIRLSRSVRWSVEELKAWLSAKDPRTGLLPTREQWLAMQNAGKAVRMGVQKAGPAILHPNTANQAAYFES